MRRHSLLCSLLFGLSALALLLLGRPLRFAVAGRAAAQTCTFNLTPAASNFQAGGGSGGVAVTASQAACTWTANSNVAWLNITAGAAGTGNGLVSFTVAANPGAAVRTGTLTVAGQTFTVNQDGGLAGLQFYPLPAPVRLLDTRLGTSPNACSQPNAPIAGNTVRTQAARNFCGLPVNAQALTGNVTTVQSGGGFLTLYPSGAAQPTVASTNFTANEIVNNVFTVGLGVADGAFNIYALTTTEVVVDVTGYYAPPATAGLYFHPLPSPVRLLETRAGQTVGCVRPGAPLPGGVDTLQTAVSTCTGIPPMARAIAGNATTVGPQSGGYLTLFPADAARPLVASSNYEFNQIVNGPFTVGLSPAGQFKIFTTATTELVIDVLGYFSAEAVDANGAGLLFTPLAHPVRLLETRNNAAFPGCFKPNVPLNGNQVYTQVARGLCDGLTIPATALGVVGNATVVLPVGGGYLTVWPSSATQPTIATSNYNAGQIINRHFITGLGNADGAFKLYSQATTDLVIDLAGYFTPPPANQPPLANAGADQTIAQTATAQLAGQVSDDGLPIGSSLTANWSKLSGLGTVTFGNANQAATTATFSATGVYVLRLTANDSALAVSDDVQITVNGPLTVNAGADQVITLPNTAMLLGTVTGGATSTEWSLLSGPASVLFGNASGLATSALFRVNGTYSLRLTVMNGQSSASDDVQVIVNADPTTPPTLSAPPLDMTVATTLGDATEFLYTGPNPVQTGVAPGTINKVRAAVLKGRVLDKNNNPLPLVKVTVLNHPEYGQTLSRADGRFDLAVNGGGVLTVQYEKVGFLPLQRTDNVPWQDYCGVPDVVLMGYDANVAFIDLLAATPIQVAQSSVNTDSSGTRRTALLFKQGTTATMKLPGGAMVGLDKVHVRATEFTTGANGVNAMPGELPANSAYTYAVEYSLDEAVAAGATETTFSQPVVQYNENFLHFEVGGDIPSGAYDRTTGQWVASASGRVVKILSLTSGTANLDVNGNGVPATDPQYAALGINTAERQTLATLYAVNQSLWRVPIIHFSPWDSNWPYGPPPDAGPPGGGPPSNGDAPPDDQDECDGCIIGAQGQTLGEELSIVGSPFKLRYSSDRKTGRVAARSINVPLSGAALPASLKRIELTVTVAGRTFTQSFPAQINQSTVFTWDGLDTYGRTMQGKQTAMVRVGNVYDGSYIRTSQFGYNGNGVPITGDAARREITLAQVTQRMLGAFDDRALSLGGWSLDVHHFYDPNDHTLYEGNGARRTVQTINASITTVAGTGTQSFSGDGGLATAAAFNFPFSATAAPNGELYVADSVNKRIRKVDLNGIVTTVAGTGAGCTPTLPCGDGGQAVNAQLNHPSDTAFSPDGSLYIFDAQAFRVRKVAPGGVITTVVGTGQTCADPTGGCGDGGPATQAQLSTTAGCCRYNLTVAPDGALYLTDAGNRRVRRVGPDGIITTIAGNGRTAAQGGCTVVGSSPVSAVNACLNEPLGVKAAADGSVYFTDFVLNQIFRVTADGFIRVVAGDGVCGNTGDGGPAVSARLCNPHGIAQGPDGALVFADWSNARIRRIDANGIITNYTGTGVLGFSGDGGPARAAQIRQSLQVAFGPDGAIYISDTNNHRIRKVFPPLPGFNNSHIAVPSRDGSELFKFNSAGRHLQTINTLTNAVKYTFGYDGAGRLITVTDGDNNVTTIQRNGSGQPTGILSPFNQLTTVTLDANGYFATITNPNNEQNQFTYTSGGLLTLKRDPRNNQNAFTYDAQGRLTRDDDAATGFQTLARSETGANYTVTRNTALNQTSTFQVQNLATGDRQRTTTLSNGLQEILIERQNGTSTLTAPDGTVTNRTLGPDPRWRMQAPLTTNTTVTTPANLIFNSSFGRTVALSNPADPLSLTNQTSTLNTNGRIYTSVFTAATKTFADSSPAGRQTTTVIDVQGRGTQRQFANLDAANYTYDARGRLATATFGAGGTARLFTHGYGASGFLSSITDPLNRVVGFSRDNAGRVTQQTLPDARIIGYGYDANGNLTSVTPPGRPAHSFAYNAVDLLTSYTPPTVPGTGATQFTYNPDRQLTTITRPDSLTLNFAYDAAGRLQTLTLPNGVYTYGYSGATGNLTSLSAPGGQTLNYSYDGSLLSQTVWGGVIVGSVSRTFDNNFRVASQSVNGGSTVNFTYDNDNLLTGTGSLAITRNAQNGLMAGTALGSVTDTRGYNGFGELTSYSASFNATPLYSTTHTRDKLGRVTQKIETIGGGAANTYDYAYDTAGRLMQVKLNSVTVSTYAYDSNDNRASLTTSGGTLTGTYDNQDRLTQYGATTYAYTANGELSSRASGAQTTTYNYDVVGNLRQVTLPGGTQVDYVYDGLNRRVGKKVNGTLTQGWLYQNLLKPIAELDGSNNLVSRFVYGSRTNAPDYMIKAGVTYRLITDHLGSVRLVVNTSTGAIAQRLDYDEFGVVTMDTTSPSALPAGCMIRKRS